MKIIVYTTLFGERDVLLRPHWLGENIRYVCFTDREHFHHVPEPWEIVKVTPQLKKNSTPAREGKFYKVLPHAYLGDDYDFSVWVDANFRVTKGFDALIAQMEEGGHDMLFFRHFGRDCIYTEAEVCKARGLDDPAIIDAQMKRYRDDGFPEHHGMPENCTIIRRNTKRLYQFHTHWMQEIIRGSVRDQLSAPYSLWKTKPNYRILDEHARTERYHIPSPHIKNLPPAKKKPKLVILVPIMSPDELWVSSFFSVMFALTSYYHIMVRFKNSAYLHKANCQLLGSQDMECVDFKPFEKAEDVLFQDYDYLLWFENDMIVTPGDVLQLFARDVDVISAVYRQPDNSMTYHVINEQLGYAVVPLTPPQGDDIIEVFHVPLGLTLFKRGVFEKVDYPWFQPMMVMDKDDHKSIAWTGHDAGLSDFLRAAGVKVHIDPKVRVGHRKKVTLYAGDEEKKRNDVRRGIAKAIEGLETPSRAKILKTIEGMIEPE